MKNIQSNHVKTFLVGLCLIVAWKIIDIGSILWFIKSAFQILVPFIFGAVIAFFTYKPAIKLERLLRRRCKKIKGETARGISVIFVYVALLSIVGVVLQFLIPALYANIQDFAKNVPSYYAVVEKHLKDFELFSNFKITEKITETLNGYLNFDMVGKFVGVVGNVANSMLNVVLGVILSAYILLERAGLADLFKTLTGFVFKEKKSNTLATYTGKLVDIFNSYFVSLLLDALIIGTVSSLFFYFFGAPYPWLLGVIVALGNMIPFFGPIVAAVIVFVVCAIVMGPLPALWALVFQIVAGQIDSNFIQPRLVGGSVGISPLWVIFAVTFFGGFWGPVGMIIGVPIVAAVRLVYLDYKKDGKLDGNI